MNITTLDIDELGKGRIAPKTVMLWQKALSNLYDRDSSFGALRTVSRRDLSLMFMSGKQWDEDQKNILAKRLNDKIRINTKCQDINPNQSKS